MVLNNFKGEVILSDGLVSIEGKFDLIISNLFFYMGIVIDYIIVEVFLSFVK